MVGNGADPWKRRILSGKMDEATYARIKFLETDEGGFYAANGDKNIAKMQNIGRRSTSQMVN